MKALLGLSLLVNLGMGYLYFDLKTRPPVEKVVVQEKKVFIREKPKSPMAQNPVQEKTITDTAKKALSGPQEFREYEAARQLTNERQVEYFEELGITEEMVQKKEQLAQRFFKNYEKMMGKNSTGLNLDFNTRRRLIDLEEKLHKDYERLYGRERWSKYKKFVDKNNARVLKDYNETGGSEGVMLNY